MEPPIDRPIDQGPGDQPVDEIGFLLMPDFPLYALILATEALRIANQNAGRTLFGWHLISTDGAPVKAGNGMLLPTDGSIETIPRLPMVFVCAGNRPTQHIRKPQLNWLRRLARHGAALGALDTGAFTLAEAGLLDGFRVTLHWEAIPMFRDRYPDIEVVEQLFVIDRQRLTCAGGTAMLDLMLQLIGQRHGYGLAQVVANGFVHDRIRQAAEQQRPPNEHSGDQADAQLAVVIRLMEQSLDTPLEPADLARHCGISVRRLERIMRRKLGQSPMQYYLKVRLQAARNLLFYGDASMKQIASICGFSSPPVFSRAFRRQFGHSPGEYRRQFSGEQLQRFVPEAERYRLTGPMPHARSVVATDQSSDARGQ